MIKLLLVDDSALMRKYLRTIFEDEGDFEVRTARNGRDALEQVGEFQPDVVTLDVNMPEMDGLTCLSHIMTEHPRPVVMVSSLTAEGAMVTLEALEMGAVDFIEKPDGTVSLNIGRIRAALVDKVRAAASARVRRSRGLVKRMRAQREREMERRPMRAGAARMGAPGIVLVGVSTGGPRALEDILPRLPADLPWPVVVAQHMPAAFTAVFASRMNGICELEVVEASKPMPLTPGTVYIGRGDADVVIQKRLGRLTAVPVPVDGQHLWHPSVDRLVRSAMEATSADRLIGVMLTGMGNDGAEAMAQLRRQGGHTLAESEESAVVFGMPGELVRLGGAEVVVRCADVADHIVRWLR